MSTKQSAVREKPGPGKTDVQPRRDNASREDRGDFWANFIYFMVLTVAISFILANNSLAALGSATGMVILGLLVFLDIFPIYQMIKHILYGGGK